MQGDMVVDVRLMPYTAPKALAGRELVYRKIREPRYTGKSAKNAGGTKLYQWRGWILLRHLPVQVEAWGHSPFWAPGSGWSDDVWRQPWEKEPQPQYECDLPIWAKNVGPKYVGQMARFIQECVDREV